MWIGLDNLEMQLPEISISPVEQLQLKGKASTKTAKKSEMHGEDVEDNRK
jgi:hypothetical protein